MKKNIFHRLGSLKFKNICDHFFIGDFNNDSIIIDLGANKGNFSEEFIEHFKFSKIILVEANPELVKELRSRFRHNDSIKIVHAAIGAERKKNVPFYIRQSDDLSSLREFISTDLDSEKNKRKMSVEMLTLQDIFSMFNLKKIDLLKMDIEGAEVDIIEKLQKEDFNKIDQISVEFHDFVTLSLRPRVQKCVDKLKKMGYASFNEGLENWGYGTAYYNCIFYKKTPRLVFRSYLNFSFGFFPKLYKKIFRKDQTG